MFRGKWINNLPIGKHTKYYYKGQVFKEFRPSKNEGDLTNLRQEYMEHRISSQYSYNNRGELDGDCCEFDINGMLTIYGRFKSDKKNGIWLEKNFLDNYYDIYNLGKYKNV